MHTLIYGKRKLTACRRMRNRYEAEARTLHSARDRVGSRSPNQHGLAILDLIVSCYTHFPDKGSGRTF